MKDDIASVKGEMVGIGQRLKTEMAAMERRSQAATEAMGLRLTTRLGVMTGTAVAILGAILHLR